MRLLLFVILLLLFGQCQSVPQRNIHAIPAFYAWKTHFQADSTDLRTLAQWQSRRLYIKYGDIGWQVGKGAVPVALTRMQWENLPEHIEIVPVFFIVHKVFEQINGPECDSLAQRLLRKIVYNTPQNRIIPEIQIDCDWTENTRERYFYFLKTFKNALQQTPQLANGVLSATIRLHQVKYRQKTGVPPVDRGLLMLYNFEKPSRTDIQNSILDTKTAHSYLDKTAPYPLPLDAALPLFGWGLHFRGDDFQGFLRDLRPEQARNLSFLTRVEENIFRANCDTTWSDSYFRRGDWVRIESVPPDALEKVWRMAAPLLPNDTCHLVFFDLNQPNIQYYRHEDLSQIVTGHY